MVGWHEFEGERAWAHDELFLINNTSYIPLPPPYIIRHITISTLHQPIIRTNVLKAVHTRSNPLNPRPQHLRQLDLLNSNIVGHDDGGVVASTVSNTIVSFEFVKGKRLREGERVD